MHHHGLLNVEVFTDAMFGENGYLLWVPGHDACWILDPGFPPQPEELAAAIRGNALTPAMILLTHCHPDHIAGIRPLRSLFRHLPIVAPRAEANMLVDAEANLSAQLNFPVVSPPADGLLEPGDSLQLHTLTFQVLDVAGHSPGGLAFYCRDAGVVLAGDALFADSIGRYDFPGSSRDTLLGNIQKNLLTLPDETILYSGHGPSSTIGRERKHNAVLRMELDA